jgi:hypothetical protein
MLKPLVAREAFLLEFCHAEMDEQAGFGACGIRLRNDL